MESLSCDLLFQMRSLCIFIFCAGSSIFPLASVSSSPISVESPLWWMTRDSGMPVLFLSLYSDGFNIPAALSAWKILSSATQPQELQTNSLEIISNITVSLSHCLQNVVGLLLECICCSAESIATK